MSTEMSNYFFVTKNLSIEEHICNFVAIKLSSWVVHQFVLLRQQNRRVGTLMGIKIVHFGAFVATQISSSVLNKIVLLCCGEKSCRVAPER